MVENIRRIRLGNPGWEYKFYDDQDVEVFIRKNYDARILKAYHRINPLYGATRADFFRYLLIYRRGGVYLDIKSGASRPLNEIVGQHQYVLSHWDNAPGRVNEGWGMHFTNFPQGEFQQWHVAAVPGHPFLRAIIEMALSNIENYTVERFGVGFEGAMTVTGPLAYTLAIAPCLHAASYHLARTNCELGFVYNSLNVNHKTLLYHEKRPHYTSIADPIIFS